MLRKLEYTFSREAKTPVSIESESSLDAKSQQTSSRSSTVKMFSLAFKLEVENSPIVSLDKASQASMDRALNVLFDVYFHALRMGTFALLEPIAQVLVSIADEKIVNPMATAISPSPIWKRSYSITASVTESHTAAQTSEQFRP